MPYGGRNLILAVFTQDARDALFRVRPAQLLGELEQLHDLLGFTRPLSLTDFPREFGDSFAYGLRARGMSPRYVEDLVNAAIEQAKTSAALRVIAKEGWSAAAANIVGMDAFATGSLARWESGIASDFDFNFLAADEAELRTNKFLVSPPLTVVKIRARWRVLHAGPFGQTYRSTAGGLGYDFVDTKVNGFVFSVSEFNRSLLPASLFARSSANYRSSVMDLRATARRRGGITPMISAATIGELVEVKLALAQSYLGRFRVEAHPHPAHGVASQVWQAILFASSRPRPPSLLTPYWAAPLIIPLDRGAQATWHVFSRGLSTLRTGGSALVADHTVSRALLELARSARFDRFIDGDTETAIRRALL